MSISLLTLDDLRDVERRQASVLESGTLMERAGQDIASRLERELPPKGRVTILCGTGNNGGDGCPLPQGPGPRRDLCAGRRG